MLLFGIYYLVPFTNRTSGGSLLRLVLAMALFTAVLVWQVRRIMGADLPGLRAVQALGGAIPLFLVVFAAGYYSARPWPRPPTSASRSTTRAPST